MKLYTRTYDVRDLVSGEVFSSGLSKIEAARDLLNNHKSYLRRCGGNHRLEIGSVLTLWNRKTLPAVSYARGGPAKDKMKSFLTS